MIGPDAERAPLLAEILRAVVRSFDAALVAATWFKQPSTMCG